MKAGPKILQIAPNFERPAKKLEKMMHLLYYVNKNRKIRRDKTSIEDMEYIYNNLKEH